MLLFTYSFPISDIAGTILIGFGVSVHERTKKFLTDGQAFFLLVESEVIFRLLAEDGFK